MTRKRKRGNVKGSTAAPKSAVSLAALPSAWDMGATGPANRVGMVMEERGETDPKTGKRHNPNNVQGVRRVLPIDALAATGRISAAQRITAVKLRQLADGEQAQDPLAALGIYVASSGHDPNAARVDRRRPFYEMWAKAPKECATALEMVILNDKTLEDASGPRMADRLDTLAKIRVGLDWIEEGMA